MDKPTILVIEDDENTRSLVALYLEREGFPAVTAGDGEAGLRLADRHHPDLVILDLMIPKVDGWEVCRRLRVDVAHELRTPLTNIRGYLEALNDGVLPPDPSTLSLLQKETLRLADLVEDVLALARADAAGRALQPEPLDVNAMVKETVATFRPAVQKRGLSVDVKPSPERIIVHADPRHLSRVLRNLTDNAVRYATAGSMVFIAIVREEEAVRIDYANTADDLLPEDLPFLFERFFRGEKSRSRRHGGAGIGLSIVKELVEAHGGTVYGELADGWIHFGFTLP